MTATDYLEGKLLDHVLRNTAYVQPTGLWLALHTSDPSETGALNEVTPGTHTYARQSIAFAAQAGSSAPSNTSQTFLDMPAVTVTHFTIKDAVTGGNTLFWGVMSVARTMSAGDPLVFGAGQIVVTCD